MRYVLDKGGWSEDYFFEDFELELFNLKFRNIFLMTLLFLSKIHEKSKILVKNRNKIIDIIFIMHKILWVKILIYANHILFLIHVLI